MLRRNRTFRDRTYPFDTDFRWWINFQEIKIQTRRHRDHNRLHWEGHCNQRLDRFLKLTPLFQVGLVTRSSSPVVLVSKTYVASSSGWFKTDLFRGLRLSLTFNGERFATPQKLTFKVIIPYTSLCGVCHSLVVGSEHATRSNATSSDKTLTLFSEKIAFRILLSVWISTIIPEMKIAEKKSKSTKLLMQQTTDG